MLSEEPNSTISSIKMLDSAITPYEMDSALSPDGARGLVLKSKSNRFNPKPNPSNNNPSIEVGSSMIDFN